MGIGTVYRVGLRSGNPPYANIGYSWNTRHYRCTSTASPDSASDVIAAFRRVVEPRIKPCMAKSTAIVRYEAALADSPTIVLSSSDVIVNGTGTTIGKMPSFLCGLIRLHWSTSTGAKYPGKWYQAQMPLMQTDTDSTAYTSALDDLAAFLSFQISSAPSGAAIYRPVIWHRATGTATNIFLGVADHRYHTYRTRGRSAADNTMSFRGLCSLS